MLKITLVALVCLIVVTVKPPVPACRANPFPSIIPVSIGQMSRFDLEDVFSGYNLSMKGYGKSNIQVSQKYNKTVGRFNKSMNFINTKIKPNNRFIGIIQTNQTTTVVIGINNDDTGVQIQKQVDIQNDHFMRCFDVEEVFDEVANKAYVMVDCGVFSLGGIRRNQFKYVDLETYKLFLGSFSNDVFVQYQDVRSRKIQLIIDPIHRTQYLWRFYTRDGVDARHADQTYAEVFLIRNPIQPQLLDVIDYTFLKLDKLSVSDFQVHLNYIYILNYDDGVYQIIFNNQFRLQVRAFIPMSQGITRFRVDQLGFDDDLNLIGVNDQSVYQYQLDITSTPKLVAKYTLLPYSHIEHIFVDFHYVILLSRNTIDGINHRKIWIFSRRTPNYMSVYGSFNVPLAGPVIINWQQHGSVFHAFTEYQFIIVRMSLPYLTIIANDSSLAGKFDQYTLQATSTEAGIYTSCQVKLQIIYQDPKNQTVIKTGLMGRNQTYVDSPDERDIELEYEFFGPNLTYNVKYDINSSILPRHYINKQHNAVIAWPTEIKPQSIVYFQMFTQVVFDEKVPNSVYGLIQTKQATGYLLTYVHCQINVFDFDEVHHLNCTKVYSSIIPEQVGQILKLTQMFDPNERRIGIVFSKNPHQVLVYYFYKQYIIYYGKIVYSGFFDDSLTSVAIHNNQIYCIFQFGKRVDVYNLRDIEDIQEVRIPPRPILVLNSQMMRFFGIEYFAPTDITVSQYHPQVIFLKTKTGIMALNVNEFGMPQLLWNEELPSSKYDFEVSANQMVVITQNQTILYRLQVPIRRFANPIILQKLTDRYKLKQYDQLTCDSLFYIVRDKGVTVLHPNMPSTSIYYSQFQLGEDITNIDAVSISDKEILFIHTQKEIKAVVFAKNPRLHLHWYENQIDFNMSLFAINGKQQLSQPYFLKFDVLPSSQIDITPTQHFDPEAIKKLGHVKTPQKNDKAHNINVTIPDRHWFNGTVLRYRLNCTSCGKNVFLKNHISESKDILAARAIYDLQSTYEGIYAQQYRSLIKTFTHNDSIEHISSIPTQALLEACSKVSAPLLNYALSFCEQDSRVNIYLTSYLAFKPFTIGPFPTEAKAVNYAKVVKDVVMIVDNDDNPFMRAGGVYLYAFNANPAHPAFRFLDYLDYDDLQLQGFRGQPYIGSADLHKPVFGEQRFRLFLTESRTGAIFIFSFQLTKDYTQVIYTSKKFIPLQKFIPQSIKAPTPIKILTISIIQSQITGSNRMEYTLLLTASNWHHLYIKITLDQADNILFFELVRLFERFPWTLQNYVKIRSNSFQENNRYFAVSYVNNVLSRQIVGVYYMPRHQNQSGVVPITPMIGAHWVREKFEVSFAFNNFIEKLLFVDVDAYNITQLDISLGNVTLEIKDMIQPQDITVIAENGYSNYSFTVEVRFQFDDETNLSTIWIVLTIIGAVMIVGLIIVWVRVSKKNPTHENKQSLITIEDQYKDAYINRSSVDPQSQRNTLDLRQQPTKDDKLKVQESQENIQKQKQTN